MTVENMMVAAVFVSPGHWDEDGLWVAGTGHAPTTTSYLCSRRHRWSVTL